MRWLGFVLVVTVGCFAPQPEVDAGVVPVVVEPCLAPLSPLDFGEVQTGERGVRTVSLRNETSRVLELTVKTVQAPFGAGLVLGGPIAPGSTATLSVTFAPFDALLHVARLEIDPGKGCPVAQLELRGLGGGAVVAPALVDFGAVPLGVTSQTSMTLLNTRRVAVDVQLFDLERSSPFTLPAMVHLEPQSSQAVQLSFQPFVPGPAETSVSFTSALGDRGLFTLAAVGGFPDARVSPSALQIAHLPVGLPVTRRVVVGNGGPGELHLSSARVTASTPPFAIGELQVVRFPPFISAGTEVPAVLQIVAGSPGSRAWVVTFETNQPDRPFLDVTVAGTAEPIGACVDLTLPPADVAIPMGATSVALQLANGPSGSCLIDDVRFEAGPATTWSVTPSSDQLILAPSASSTWTVSAPSPGAGRLFFTPVNSLSTERVVNVVAP